MSSENRQPDSPIEPENVESPASMEWDYQVSVPTQWYIRGKNPMLHLLSEEQMDALESGGNPWPQNFFFATFTLAAGIFVTLKAGVVDPSSRSDLWNIFFSMVFLSAFFGILAIRDYQKTKKKKQEIKSNTPTVQAGAPTVPARTVQKEATPPHP